MGGNVLTKLLGQTGLYGRSLGFFLLMGALLFGAISYFSNPLQADETVNPGSSTTFDETALELTLTEDGRIFAGKTPVGAELFTSSTTYRFRYQVVNQPRDFIEELTVILRLPRPGTDETIGHRFINNGGADAATSELLDPQTVLYTARGIASQAQLSLELEVPKSFITRSAGFAAKQWLNNLPPYVWASLTIGLPALTVLLLLLVAMGRIRKVTPLPGELTDLPSRLPPALLGILLRGRLTSRELAATFLDLARRGHLVIRQLSADDFRFRRQVPPPAGSKLADFEQVLLDQIFGPTGDKASADDISFSLAQEVFSKRVSEAFILAYRKMNDLGYFYTNPLSLHRRYQIIGVILFILGIVGFTLNLMLFTDVGYGLLFWLGMMISALMIFFFSRGLPMRTVYGDRELARWLAFRRSLTSREPVNYAAQSQEKYLALLPYAVVLEAEVEWTKRFYELPFAQPTWYIAANISTIDRFANSIFPLFGYLSHALALSARPVSR